MLAWGVLWEGHRLTVHAGLGRAVGGTQADSTCWLGACCGRDTGRQYMLAWGVLWEGHRPTVHAHMLLSLSVYLCPLRCAGYPLHPPWQVHEEEDALNVWMYDAVENNGKYTRWQALAQLLTALGLMAGLYGLSVLYDAPSRNPAVSMAPQQQSAPFSFVSATYPYPLQVPKEYPFDNLYLERGGDPNQLPTEADRKEKVHSSYGTLTS